MRERVLEYCDVGGAEKRIKEVWGDNDSKERKRKRIEMCSSGDLSSLQELSELEKNSQYAERVAEFKRSLFSFVDSATERKGIGSNNEFFVVENSDETVSHLASAELGVRRIKREKRRHQKTGEFYWGIPVSPEQPRPLNDFINGIELQMLAHEKGLNVPFVCSVIQVEGAVAINDNADSKLNNQDESIIEGTEEIVFDIMAVMEKIEGITFEQLCDPDFSLRKTKKDHKDGYQIKNFFRIKSEEIASNIIARIENGHRYILTWDFDLILKKIKDQVNAMHSADEEFPAILHNDLHAGNIIIRPDGEVFLIDFDLAKIVDVEAGEDAGISIDDYLDAGKTIGEKYVFYLPDAYDKQENNYNYYPMSALDQIELYINFVKNTVEKYKHKLETNS